MSKEFPLRFEIPCSIFVIPYFLGVIFRTPMPPPRILSFLIESLRAFISAAGTVFFPPFQRSSTSYFLAFMPIFSTGIFRVSSATLFVATPRKRWKPLRPAFTDWLGGAAEGLTGAVRPAH